MKMISIDDLIKYCDIERAAYKANNCGSSCTALRRVAEFAKEYAVEAEPDNGWISVKDRLPPYGERVLVVNEAYEEKHGYTKYNCGVTIRAQHLDFTFWGYKVTHWMPLPESPKGVDAE